MSLTSTEQLFIERPLYRCFLRNDHLPFLLWNVIGLNNFPSFSCLLLDFLLISTEKMKKKGNTPMEFKYLLFCLMSQISKEI